MKKIEYEAPSLNVIEIEIEKGFAVSGDGQGTGNNFGGGWG